MTWFLGGLVGAALAACVIGTFFVYVAADAKAKYEAGDALRCVEGGKEHDFEAVFDSVVVKGPYSGVPHVVKNAYVRHVCIDCGTTVERTSSTSQNSMQ